MSSVRSHTPRRLIASAITAVMVMAVALIGGVAPAQAAGTPTITVTEAPRAGGTVTVTGSGFSGVSPGVYVGLAPSGGSGFYAITPTDFVFAGVNNVANDSNPAGRTAPMTVDGSFSFTMTVPAFVDGTSWSLYTSKAHGQGITDKSQDLIASVSYAAAPAVIETTTSLVSSNNPSTVGSDVTLTATVSAGTGTITFFDGSTSLGGGAVGPDGTRTLTTNTLSQGSHNLTASFVPSTSAFVGSTSARIVQEVTAAAPTVVATTTTLTGPASGTSVAGQTAQFTVLITPLASGTVELFDGAISVGSAPVIDGLGLVPTSALSVGTHNLIAAFTPTDTVAFGPSTSAALAHTVTAAPVVVAPSVKVTLADGTPYTNQALPAGAELIVTGTGFVAGTPDSNGTRPPLAGKFAGNYVTVGNFLPNWKPSAGALGSTRKTFDTKWAVLAADMNTIGGPSAGAIELKADGTFTTTLTVPASDVAGQLTGGTWGIYTYSGSGAKATAFETATPITLAPVDTETPETPDLTLTVTPGGTVKAGSSITITGAGFASGEKVAGVVNSDPVNLGEQTANSTGEVTFVWSIPANFEAGAHTVTLTGASGEVSAPLQTAAADPIVVIPPTCEARVVSGATLNWGLKESWRSYVVGSIAKGSWSVNGITDSAGNFGWTGGTGVYNLAAGTSGTSFAGSVQFLGHAGLLDLTFANPRVVVTGAGTGELIFDVYGKDTLGNVIDYRGASVASLAFTGSVMGNQYVVTNAAATLTPTGALAFGGFYEAGADLDPVSFTLPLGAATACVTPIKGGEVPGSPAPFTPPVTQVNNTPAISTPAAATPAAAKCVANAVSGARLTWGVKSSFRTYVTGPIAGGSIATNGASQSNGLFTWSGGRGAFNPEAGKGSASFSGSISFTGHAGKLDLVISSPRVQVFSNGSANLVANVTSKSLNGPDVAKNGVVLATLSLPAATTSNGVRTWSGASATLTTSGAEAFGGFYQAGQAMDSVTFSLPLGADVECDASSGTLAATGAETDSAALVALSMMVLGTLLVVARRRRGASA